MRTRTNDTGVGSAPAKAGVQSKGEAHVPERSCILTRRTAPREELIRLALGPDGQVAPDVRARAPGRGAWIGVGRKALDEANAKGTLKGALTRAFRTGDIDVPADLGERIEGALRSQALDRLGLEARGGTLINGAERVEAAARQGKVVLLIHAADAGEDGRKKLDQAWRVGGGDMDAAGMETASNAGARGGQGSLERGRPLAWDAGPRGRLGSGWADRPQTSPRQAAADARRLHAQVMGRNDRSIVRRL